jgi:hypothetical protein
MPDARMCRMAVCEKEPQKQTVFWEKGKSLSPDREHSHDEIKLASAQLEKTVPNDSE